MALIAADYARLPTERANPATRKIDQLSTRAIVALINSQDRLVAPAVGKQAASIAKAADVVAAAIAQGGRVLLVGAGTSGRLCVLEAAECPPSFGTPPDLIRAEIAGGRGSVFRAKEGAEDDERAGAKACAKLKAGDVVIGVAASGITPFVRAALSRARQLRCRTVLVTSNAKPKGDPAQITIAPVVGPEVLAGSTRLKSATAAKLVLNCVTTAAMIRLNKVYDHWMVDLKPTNRKLKLRAVRLISELARLPAPQAERVLAQAGGSVKTAVVMARLSLTRADALGRLKAANGSLRRALESR
jgi:N-acetylmuramic acid 6-phosphate etherase